MTATVEEKTSSLGLEQHRVVEITQGPTGRRLSRPVRLQLSTPSSRGEESFQRWVVDAFSWKMPALVEFTLQSRTLSELARRIMLSNSGSKATAYQYIYGIHRYCSWIGRGPDQLISQCLGPDGEPSQSRVNGHLRDLDRFVMELKALGLAPGTISNHVKGVRALYRASGLKLELPYRLSRRVVYYDRAPTQEELARMMDVADVRGRAVLAMLALGGFRVGTLVRLCYRHVKQDLERGVRPLHVHVEAGITKGGYGDYDTFLGPEAVDALSLYLEERRRGRLYSQKQPEQIRDDMPLIRSEEARDIRPLTPGGVHRIVHNLLLKTDLLPKTTRTRYELRPHSIRKFFRTQLAALGVNNDYIEYMMGHKTPTYHDVRMLGVEKLRQIYNRAGLAVKPRREVSKVEMLKEFTRSLGMDPEKILVRDALAEAHRTVTGPETELQRQYQALGTALREWIRQEAVKPTSSSE